ncbi:MAG: acyl-phosphate glycerol 3-phosphate acyltransferase [Coriobacteriaceae bacterium]|nr:acyl-phosphate glycerol 3-phosphate acyltransferase [Coriobacteriaceae bacterium]
MSDVLRIVAALAAAYLIGGVPFALIVGKLGYRTDVREHGSGNLGGTNVYRVLGWKAGLLTALGDIAKGAVAVFLARLVAPPGLSAAGVDWVSLGAAVAAIAGHSYTPYAGFRGGKGVATAGGTIIVLTPLTFPVLVVTFVAVIALSRYVSAGSVTAAAVYAPLVALLYPGRVPLIVFAGGAAALVIFRHISNVRRILRGEERRIEWTPRGTRNGEGR